VLGPIFLFSGYLWGAFHPYRRCWHDLLADTVVIDGPLRLGLLETYDEGGSLCRISLPDGGTKKSTQAVTQVSRPSERDKSGNSASGGKSTHSKSSQLEYGFDE
jgi:hypothetical protein